MYYEQMYKFENDTRLYKFRFKDDGIPMWMYIRSWFIRSVTDKAGWRKADEIWKKKMERPYIKKDILNKYIKKNPFLSKKNDILFAFWGYSELSRHDDGLVYEEFIMPFLRMFPNNTATLMDGRILNNYELDCAHPNWKMDDIFMDILKMCRIIKKHHDLNVEDKKNIKRLMNFLNHNCPLRISQDLRKEAEKRLEDVSWNSKYMIKICENYLRVIKPKVTVICCASYPDILRTSMILACRNRNVVTAELQHGLVGRNHANYHYCEYILNNSDCCKMLPDYYLTFGNYWNSLVNVPMKCKVIGYAKHVMQNVVINKKILFCAGINFDEYIEFLDGIVPKLDESVEIYFRFHPVYSSKRQKDRFNKYFKFPNFYAADEKDLYFYMKDCQYVIQDGSTICYEALFMGKIVFSFRSEQSIRLGVNRIPDVHSFNSAEDFMELWNGRDKLQSKCHDEFFDLNYKENYIKFLKECGVNIK